MAGHENHEVSWMTDYTDPYHSVEMNYGFISLAAERTEARGPPLPYPEAWKEHSDGLPQCGFEKTERGQVSEALPRMQAGGENSRDGA